MHVTQHHHPTSTHHPKKQRKLTPLQHSLFIFNLLKEHLNRSTSLALVDDTHPSLP
jgi:hypothetical protein